MLSQLFLTLVQGSGTRRRWLFRNLFELIARLSADQSAWTFMNYGFANAAGPCLPAGLTAEEEAQRVCCQLYDRVCGAVALAGRDVVEISCGRGGGAAFVARHFDPRSVTGIDIAHNAIDFCRRTHALGNLRFVQGDAESLPLFDRSADIVVNVEASFCYGDFDRFLSEVSRVLRPGGAFLYADLRFADEIDGWLAALGRSGLELIECEDISQNVLDALELDAERRERGIRESAPRLLRGGLRTFAGTRGSRIPVLLARGDLRYYRFVLAKPVGAAASPAELPKASQEVMAGMAGRGRN